MGPAQDLKGAPSHTFDPNSSAPAKLVPGFSLHLWALGFAHIVISLTKVPSLPAQTSESSLPPPPITLL